MNDKNIILIGMPGSGKSTLGVILSKKLNYGFVDSDSIMVAYHGKLLPELIDENGAEGFLDLEERINSAISVKRCVISTGGSVIYRGNVIDKFKETGIVVYLKIPYDEIVSRVGDLKKRGVVIKQGSSLKDLYNERVPLYEKHADITVELNENSIEENAEKIYNIVKNLI